MVDFPVFVGDTPDPETVPTSGAVPAPEKGDSSRNFYLSAEGLWKAPSALEPISWIKIPSGTTNVYITKLGNYDFIRLTMVDTLPTTSNALIRAHILKGDDLSFWTGASVIYTQRTTSFYAAATVEGAVDTGSGAYFVLGEHGTSPNPANSGIQNSVTSSSAYYIGEYWFNNFSNTVASKNITILSGRYSYEAVSGSLMNGVTTGQCATDLSGKRTGIHLTPSTGTFAGGVIVVEGIRYNAAYNNNFTIFS